MEREEAIQALKDLRDIRLQGVEWTEPLDMAIEALTEPKTIRCKDCKWYMRTDHNETAVCTNKQWDISMAVYPIISADDFCSYGERREP